jgi:hypothetical protein
MKTPTILRDFKVDHVKAIADVWQVLVYAAIFLKERVLHSITMWHKVKELQEYFTRAHSETGRYGYGFYNQHVAEVGYLCASYPDLAKEFEKPFSTADKDLLIEGLATEFNGAQAREFTQRAQGCSAVEATELYFHLLEKTAREKAEEFSRNAFQSCLYEAKYITLRLMTQHENTMNNFLKYESAVGKYITYIWAAFFLLYVVGLDAAWMLGAEVATLVLTLVLYGVDLYNKPTVIKATGDLYEIKSFNNMLNSSQLSSVHLKWYIAQYKDN